MRFRTINTQLMSMQTDMQSDTPTIERLAFNRPENGVLPQGASAILLPWGIFAAGAWQRAVVVMPLTGEEEELLLHNPQAAPAALCTALLARCLRRVGTLAPIGEATARQLLVADRSYALLMVRAAMLGTRVEAVVQCSQPACQAKMNVDFALTDLQVTAPVAPQANFAVLLPAAITGADELALTLRLPNGGDQEAVAPLLQAGDEAAATHRLLARCILRLGAVEAPDEAMIARLAPAIHQQLAHHLASLAPALELVMEGNCIACGCAFALPFDFTHFVLRELRSGAATLYNEIHALAYHYHWGERELLQMTRQKRRRYLALLTDALTVGREEAFA